jgi:hypothetical protein
MHDFTYLLIRLDDQAAKESQIGPSFAFVCAISVRDQCDRDSSSLILSFFRLSEATSVSSGSGRDISV